MALLLEAVKGTREAFYEYDIPGHYEPLSDYVNLPDWDEKAGLPRDALSSQGSTCSRHKEKETGNGED